MPDSPAAELRTVDGDGNVTSEELDVAVLRTPEGRALLDSWAQQQEAWESYCEQQARIINETGA